MSDRAELLAIFKNDLAKLEALAGRIASIPLSCNGNKAQGESGLEIRRLLGTYVEDRCDTELLIIDFLRGYGDMQGMSDLERSQHRANRADDLLDATQYAYEKLNDYVHGRAA